MFKKFLFSFIIGLFAISSISYALEDNKNFFIDSKYDISNRETINAQLIKTTNKIDFYIDQEWLKSYNYDSDKLNNLLYFVASNFEYSIYPKLINIYGAPLEWQNSQWRLTIVFHSLKKDYGGYSRSQDVYYNNLPINFGNSNKEDVIFLNTNILNATPFKISSYLAHEFVHLLSLHIKLKGYNAQDDVWLEELRAELSEIITQNFNDNFGESILKKRMQDFIFLNNFSLSKWNNSNQDYAIVNLLGQYLLEKYGSNILKDSLNSPLTGVASVEYALKKNGYNINFSKVIQNWMIATVLNDCSQNELYCFKNPFLKNLKKDGDVYFLPTKVESQMVITDYLKDTSGKWLKLVGGMAFLNIKFTLNNKTPIDTIPYVVIKTDGFREIGFLFMNLPINYNLYLKNNNDIEGLIFIISLKDDTEKSYDYTIEINSSSYNAQQEQQVIKQLQAQIETLKRQLAQLQMQVALQNTYQTNPTCSLFTSDLYYGMTSNEVKCLQQFLANLGDDIYPEKLITGYYGPLTMAAVKRYQALKGIITTGYFGPLTRSKVNQEL